MHRDQMQAVVTGGTSFIGSAPVETVVEHGASGNELLSEPVAAKMAGLAMKSV